MIDARFRSRVRPAAVPETLEDLQGPATGIVALPRKLYWGPARVFNLGDLGETKIVYRAVINEGNIEDVRRYINPQRLIEVWPGLTLPWTTLEAWEARFSQLRQEGRPKFGAAS